MELAKIEWNCQYSIRVDGNCLNSKGRILKQVYDKYGYKSCWIYKNGKRKRFLTHRLVAIAFIPNTNQKPQVNHINGVKDDNRVENLEWVNNAENIIHSFKNGRKAPNGEKCHSAKLNTENVIKIRLDLASGEKVKNIAAKLNVSLSCIYRIRNKKRWSHI